MQRRQVGLRRNVRILQDCLRLGSEPEGPAVFEIEERLLAEAVAGHEQPAAAGVPESEGEHAAQMGDTVVAILFVEVEDGFGVAVRTELVTATLEIPAERPEVVDLPVEHHAQRAVLVRHRLVRAVAEIDDLQAAAGQSDRPVAPDTAIVWTPVAECLGHASHEARIDGLSGIERQLAGYAAHGESGTKRLA